jgi:hypothetical protein
MLNVFIGSLFEALAICVGRRLPLCQVTSCRMPKLSTNHGMLSASRFMGFFLRDGLIQALEAASWVCASLEKPCRRKNAMKK